MVKEIRIYTPHTHTHSKYNNKLEKSESKIKKNMKKAPRSKTYVAYFNIFPTQIIVIIIFSFLTFFFIYPFSIYIFYLTFFHFMNCILYQHQYVYTEFSIYTHTLYLISLFIIHSYNERIRITYFQDYKFAFTNICFTPIFVKKWYTYVCTYSKKK